MTPPGAYTIEQVIIELGLELHELFGSGIFLQQTDAVCPPFIALRTWKAIFTPFTWAASILLIDAKNCNAHCATLSLGKTCLPLLLIHLQTLQTTDFPVMDNNPVHGQQSSY